MMKRKVLFLIMLSGSLAVSFLLGELVIRFAGHEDENGNFFVGSFRCSPYRLPVKHLNRIVEQYLASKNRMIEYDPDLGWAPAPHSRTGLYCYDGGGIRISCAKSEEITKNPPQGILRIAIFGDSFTQGDVVRYEETWGYSLERHLNEYGVKAQVLNFGVSGYGMDQAYLRWKIVGKSYAPDIVILGLQLDDIARNINLIRAFYSVNTGLPFSKPRFILEKEDLKLINVPAVPPERLVDVITRLDRWEYAPYEAYYRPEQYQDSFLFHSKLMAYVNPFFQKTSSGENPQSLSLKILSRFREDVESRGKMFLTVFLPKDTQLMASERDFLREVGRRTLLINPWDRFSQRAQELGRSRLFKKGRSGHYKPVSHELIGAEVANFLLKSGKLSLPESQSSSGNPVTPF